MAALKEKAARSGRSLQQELLAVLDRAAVQPSRRRPSLRGHVVSSGNTGSWDRADLYDDER